MPAIRIATLAATVESGWSDRTDDVEATVVLSFGSAEIVRWPVPQESVWSFTEGPDVEEELEYFVARKLAALFEAKEEQ